MLVALGKEDGKGGRGEGRRVGGYNNTGKKLYGKGCGEWDEGITELKTQVISAAAERKLCLLLGEACMAACSRG